MPGSLKEILGSNDYAFLINLFPELSRVLSRYWLHERITLTENRKCNLKQDSVGIYSRDYSMDGLGGFIYLNSLGTDQLAERRGE